MLVALHVRLPESGRVVAVESVPKSPAGVVSAFLTAVRRFQLWRALEMNNASIPDTHTAALVGEKVKDVELNAIEVVVDEDLEATKQGLPLPETGSKGKWKIRKRKRDAKLKKKRDDTPPASYWELYK